MIIKWFLKHCTKMYNTYNKVSDVFTEPVLHFYHGSWKDYPGLPVWRRGNVITIGKYYQYHSINDACWSDGQEWNEEFIETCSWFGKLWRRFVKPMYHLPNWLSFYVFNEDAWIKSKWDYFSYEFPPQFCIVFFGRCIAWTLSAPHATSDTIWEGTNKSFPDNTAYWESIADYLWMSDTSKSTEDRLKESQGHFYCTTLRTPNEKDKYNKLLDEESILNRMDENYIVKCDKLVKQKKKLGHSIARLVCRPEYIKTKYIVTYARIFSEIRNSKKNKNYIWIY